jgi:hypothetical protein
MTEPSQGAGRSLCDLEKSDDLLRDRAGISPVGCTVHAWTVRPVPDSLMLGVPVTLHGMHGFRLGKAIGSPWQKRRPGCGRRRALLVGAE